MNLARVVFVPALHPDDDNAEEFFAPELRQLAAMVEVLQAPLRPRTEVSRPGVDAARMLAPSVLAAALVVALRTPLRVARAIRPLLDARRPGKTARQLLCVPKALWLSHRLRPGDVVVAGWLTTPAAAAMVSARLAGVPWVSYAHRRDIEEAGSVHAKARDAAFIRVISEASEATLSERTGGAHHSRLIHLGVDLPLTTAPLPRPDALRVLIIGHLIPLKNHATALQALAISDPSHVQLTIVGAGPLALDLEALADELGVRSRTHFAGYVDHEELLRLVLDGNWDLVTSCSTTEGIPVSLMEAFAAGLPVVASDVGGVSELVGPAGGTLVGDPFDRDAFAQAWRITASEWTAEAAARARDVVATEFSAASTAARLLVELRAVAGALSPAGPGRRRRRRRRRDG